jgi:glucose/arabinose dehydrogenase
MGQVARKYEVEKHQTVANQRQRITALKISYDGVILVATMEPNSQIWLWNTGNDSDGYVLPGYHGTSDISFSPDSSLLAAGSMVSKSIQILKIPDEYNF